MTKAQGACKGPGNGPDIKTARLNSAQYAENFSEMHPPLSSAAALIEADRCYFCYDAPCATACPTDIDVAGFIRMIAAGNNIGAARRILEENIMGGSCARVCPTETLCEQACVRNEQDQWPVSIGLLQRHAVDEVIDAGKQFFNRKAQTGKRVAVVGAGPAGLSCAHGLVREGHAVTVFEASDKSGGLNETGLATYKMLDQFAGREIDYILAIGGIEVRHGQRLGEEFELPDLLQEYDAVFLGIGLASTNRLGLANEDSNGIIDAVDYIAQLRQSENMADLPVGKQVVVIGGGMTAIDIACQIKLLGAQEVTLVYRRGQKQMNASAKEQAFAQTKGVTIRHHAMPQELKVVDGHVQSISFEETNVDTNGKLTGTGQFFSLEADMVFKAIGQNFSDKPFASLSKLEMKNNRIKVDAQRKTSVAKLWAGGDCIHEGEDLTVAAVQDGKLAARSINLALAIKS